MSFFFISGAKPYIASDRVKYEMGSETLEKPYAKRIDDAFGKPLER